MQRLAELPPATTVILAVTPSIGSDALDWLNLNRPVIADRRLNIVLWCEGDAAAVLACGAPDFFDWISARVDCPPAAAAFAVTEVKAAIRARAPGIAWAGPGLVETLAAVRKEPLPAKQPFFYLQRALSIRQRILATEDHISIAQLLGLIGQILAMQGDMADAREYLERSLEIRERLLGRDHPGIAPTLNALAQVQQATGDLLGARRLVHRALAIQTVTLDAGHPR